MKESSRNSLDLGIHWSSSELATNVSEICSWLKSAPSPRLSCLYWKRVPWEVRSSQHWCLVLKASGKMTCNVWKQLSQVAALCFSMGHFDVSSIQTVCQPERRVVDAMLW